jgi:MarR family transcriptional regulator, transcriptional regulator for hemolysin
MRQRGTPIGLQLARVSKSVGRAFNDALAEVGGSLPVWLILTTLRSEAHPSQQQLARAVGIEGPTLTRHLDQLEAAGLVRRVPQPDDRRAVRVEPTEAGLALHARMLEVVIAFNRRLTTGLAQDDLERLRVLLETLEANVRESSGSL